MIKSINVKDVAIYSNRGIEINNCKKINFIYGANGSGKTIISNFLSNQADPKFSACSLQWENESTLPILVYNKEFRKRNFGNADIAGVFTLGEATKEQIAAIHKQKEDLEDIKRQIEQKKQTINHQEETKEQKTDSFQEDVWTSIFKKNEKRFKDAFSGCLKKKSFKDRLLQEYQKNKQPPQTRADLIKKAEVLFGSAPTRLPLLPNNFGNGFMEIEQDAIWSKKIVGKQDVNIAALIQKLNIGDWVNEGRKYLQNDGICPFCQQKTISDDFRAQIEDFFGGEYDTDTKRLGGLQVKYSSLVSDITDSLKKIEESEKQNSQSMLDISTFSENLSSLTNFLTGNQLLISQKIKEPSRGLELTSSSTLNGQLKQCIDDANEKISQNNKLVDNYSLEKSALISNVWALLIDENILLLDSFVRSDSGLKKGIDELTKQKKSLEEKHRNLSNEIIEATKNITSVQPSVDEMNRALTFYGFQGFKIVPSNTKNHYQIQREDGTIATETLSEGEITFITFLYFLQLVKGGSSTENITDSRVVIVDDPISSLDSNILFVVSSLLKGIIDSIKSDVGNVKQIFILTHNVYFHKETSFINGRTKENRDTYYWILRKNSNISSIKCYEMNNPISTSYELLWKELKENTNASTISIQNIMRRIIENYFKILGGYDDDDLVKTFPIQDQEIGRSLLCWINDGSHCIPDDLYIDSHDDTSDKYSEVFKKIFEKTDHIAHYNMMMKVVND